MGQRLKGEKGATDLMGMAIGLIIISIILYLFVTLYLNQPSSSSPGKMHTIGGATIDDATFQKLKAEAKKKGYNVDKGLPR